MAAHAKRPLHGLSASLPVQVCYRFLVAIYLGDLRELCYRQVCHLVRQYLFQLPVMIDGKQAGGMLCTCRLLRPSKFFPPSACCGVIPQFGRAACTHGKPPFPCPLCGLPNPLGRSVSSPTHILTDCPTPSVHGMELASLWGTAKQMRVCILRIRAYLGADVAPDGRAPPAEHFQRKPDHTLTLVLV
jgi:hypothetical protein